MNASIILPSLLQNTPVSYKDPEFALGLILITLSVMFCLHHCIFTFLEVFAARSYKDLRRKIAAHEIEPVSKFVMIQSTKDFRTNSDYLC